MARPTLNGHPKFAHLAGLVGGRGPARGYLELIWDAAYACGDPVIGDARKVEAVADWRGARGELAEALVDSGFLDPVQTDANGKHLQTYAVHDLEHHAPDYVLKRWQREAERKEKGETVRSIRQRAAAQRWKQTDANVEHEHANVRPPAPAPAPAREFSPPACDPSAMEQAAAAPEAILDAVEAEIAEDATPPPQPLPVSPYRPRVHLGAATMLFLKCFDAYPNQNAKQPAAQAWQDLAATFPGGEVGLHGAIMARFNGGMLLQHPWDRPKYCVNFERFLVERRWEDPGLKPEATTTRATGPPRNNIAVGYARASDSRHKGGGTDHEF